MEIPRNKCPNRLKIKLGALAPPLHGQMGVDAERVAKYQRGLESLDYLRIHEFLPSSIAWKRSKMLSTRMLKELAKEKANQDQLPR